MYKNIAYTRSSDGKAPSIQEQLNVIYTRIEKDILSERIRRGIQGKKALKMSRKSEIIKS